MSVPSLGLRMPPMQMSRSWIEEASSAEEQAEVDAATQERLGVQKLSHWVALDGLPEEENLLPKGTSRESTQASVTPAGGTRDQNIPGRSSSAEKESKGEAKKVALRKGTNSRAAQQKGANIVREFP